MEVVCFECFVVPNRGTLLSKLFNPEQQKERCAMLGIPTEDERLIQVWIASKQFDADNVTDHGVPRTMAAALRLSDEEAEWAYAPGYLPLSLLEGVKEGDIKEFVSPKGVRIFVKFEQRPYRYSHFGDFEEVVRKVKASTKALREVNHG